MDFPVKEIFFFFFFWSSESNNYSYLLSHFSVDSFFHNFTQSAGAGAVEYTDCTSAEG